MFSVRIFPYVANENLEKYQIRVEFIRNGKAYTRMPLISFESKEEFEKACLELKVVNEFDVVVEQINK